MQNPLQIKQNLLSIIQDNSNLLTGNLSVNGVARIAGVSDTSIIRGSAFGSVSLAEHPTTREFQPSDASAFVKDGIPPDAVIMIIEYFAYESKAKCPQALQIMRTFGVVGLMECLNPQPVALVQDKVDLRFEVLLQSSQNLVNGVNDNRRAIEETSKKVEKVEETLKMFNAPNGYETINQHIETLDVVFSTDRNTGATSVIGMYLSKNNYDKATKKVLNSTTGMKVAAWVQGATADAIQCLIREGKLTLYQGYIGKPQVRKTSDVPSRIKKLYTVSEALSLLYPQEKCISKIKGKKEDVASSRVPWFEQEGIVRNQMIFPFDIDLDDEDEDQTIA